MTYKKLTSLLVLIFILAISVSAVSANSDDNSTLVAADENIETLDANIDDGSLEVNNDDLLSYPSSSSDSGIKFDEDDITINEGDVYTIHNTLYPGNSKIKANSSTPLQNGVVHASVTSNNAGVPNANVVLSAADSGTIYSGIANNQGICDIQDVPYGDYTVTVTANGYEELTSTVTVNNEETNLNLNLINTLPLDSMYLSESGVVSGAATLISVNPWDTSGTLQYTLPSDIKRVKSAIVIVNSYSGSGNSNNYALHSDVILTTDSTTVLGSEDLYYYGNQANDPVVYVINDHTTKQYSDYQYVYNITDTVAALNAGSSLSVGVTNSKFGTYGFDGRIKMITLFLAYDDDDNDKLTYWLEIGQSWTNAFKSEIIPAGSYEGGFDNLTLETIALSTYLAEEYTLFGEILDDPTVILDGSYYKHIYWNSEDNYLSDFYMEGEDIEFAFGASQEGWGSYKTNILLFKAFEQEPTGRIYIDVYSGTTKINDASVVLLSADGETTYSATTTGLGHCEFYDIPYGEYTVTVTANGYKVFNDTVTLDEFEIFPVFELTVEDQPEYSTVHASVSSANAGVPNANVVLLDAVSGTSYTGTANTQGVCDIPDVPYGEYTVTVTANGYEELTSTVTVNRGETNLNLVLTQLDSLDSMYIHETGVVSGDALLISVNPWATSGSLQYTLSDDIKDVKSAIVIVNSYSGSGNSNNYALHSDVTLTTDSTTVLGSEDLYYYGNQANDPTVYVINDHTTKQYSDYQYVYNITDTVVALNAGSSLTVNVANSKFGTYGFDARIKMITLFLAYDDGDNDELYYWLDVGQSWTNAISSEIISTSSYTGSIDDVKLETIALSSYYAQMYELNGMFLDDPTEIASGSYYKHAYWNSDEQSLSDYIMEGEDIEFAFGASQEGWGSYKTNILLFTAYNPPSTGIVHASVICNNIEQVANANVVLTSVNSGEDYTGTTDNQGVCDIQDVPYGDYTVTVTATGYKEFTGTVTVENDETDLQIALKEDIPSTVNAMYLFDTGVVSGDARIIAVNPWTASGNLQYVLPEDVTNVKSAIVVVNSYSGSGNSNNYALHSDVTLTTDSTITLGSEDLRYTGNQASDPTVYTINGHTTKQYSDYQYYYDITDIVSALNAGSSLTINVVNSKHPDFSEFDGRIKMIALFLAYDDGDNDNITYWLDVGQHWTADTGSDTINTRSYTGPKDNLTLQNIALSSSQAKDFKLNNNLIGNPTVSQSGSFFINGYWNSENSAISDYFTQGSNTQFAYTNNGGSYKNVIVLFTATEKEVFIPDIAVNTLTTPWSEGIFAGVDNNLTIKINNNENDAVENVVVEVVSSEDDSVIATETIDSLAAGTTTVIVNDPTIRDITSETVFNQYNNNLVTYTVNVKYGDIVIDSKTYTKKVAYDGYLNKTYAYNGHNNQVNRKYTITGDIIISSQDLSKYADQYTRFRTETWDISIPEDAEIVQAFLYFNYNWDTSHFPDGWTLTFNDFEITNDYISFETDQGNLGYYGSYQYGVVVFDVSDYVLNGENTFEINKTGNCALYPSTLMVLYDLPSSTQTKDVYFTDICDVLYGYYNTEYSGKTNVFVPYEDVNLTDMAEASWYVFAGSASGNIDGNLLFNGKQFNDLWSNYSSDNTCFAYAADVTDVISEDNEAWYLTNPKSMTTVVVYEQVLVVTHEKQVPGAEISLISEYTSVPSVYAGVVNNLTLKVTNDGVADSEDVLVNVFISDELVGSETIADYVVGETYTLNIVDSTIRPVTENTVVGNNNENVVYTVVVEDANGAINSGNFSFVVVYNGNLGKDYAYPGVDPTLREYSFVGDVVVVNGNTYSASAKTNRTDVLSVDLGDGSVKEALLYVSYNFDKAAAGDFNSWNTTFNGQLIAPIASYRDQSNLGNYGNRGYGLVVYNVTDFVVDGDNSFVFNKASGNAAVYPTSLIVLVDNPASGIENNVYIVEEADLLAKTNNKNLDAVYSTAFGTVDGDATLYVFAAGAQAGEGDLVINGDVASDVWSGTSESFDVYQTAVDAGSITVDFVSTGSTILALHQMVIVQNVKPSVIIEANDLEMAYKDGSVWAVTLKDANGDAIEGAVVKIGINDEVYSIVTDENGVASLQIDLSAGTYKANASFSDDTYAEAFAEATITVVKTNPNISVFADGIAYGEDLVVNLTLSGDVSRRAVVTVDNETKYATLTNGEGSVKFTGLTAGTHTIIASYNGDVNFIKSSANVTVKVNKAPTDIDVHAVANGSDVIVDVILPKDVSRRAVVTVDNETKHVTLTNGEGSVKFTGLTIGTHTIVASYNGDSNYLKSSVNDTVKVNRVAPDIDVFAVADGSDVIVNLTLSSDVSRRAIVTIGNETKFVSLKEGKGSVKFSGLAKGTYTVVASYNGDTNYEKCSINTTVVVSRAVTDIQVTANPINYGEDAVVDIQLPSDVTRRVIVTMGNETKLVSLKDGHASVSYKGLAVGTYSINVSYNGDDNYLKSSVSTTLTVNRAVPEIQIVADDISVGEDAVINITLPSDVSRRAVVTIDGESKTVILTNGSGLVKFAGLSAGSHEVQVSYNGDSNYKASSSTTIINVKD